MGKTRFIIEIQLADKKHDCFLKTLMACAKRILEIGHSHGDIELSNHDRRALRFVENFVEDNNIPRQLLTTKVASL